jgi:hypothetical protein
VYWQGKYAGKGARDEGRAAREGMDGTRMRRVLRIIAGYQRKGFIVLYLSRKKTVAK